MYQQLSPCCVSCPAQFRKFCRVEYPQRQLAHPRPGRGLLVAFCPGSFAIVSSLLESMAEIYTTQYDSPVKRWMYKTTPFEYNSYMHDIWDYYIAPGITRLNVEFSENFTIIL